MVPLYNSSLIFLYFSFDSPFKVLSSTLNLPSISIPSAGILSPADKIIISPTTTSSTFISMVLLSLFTLHLILDDSSCNLLNAFSLPYSDMVDIKDAKKIAITMPIVSYQSNDFIRNTIFIASAISNILIIGSPKDSNNNLKKLLLTLFSNLFVPYLFLLSITSLVLSPLFIVPPK